MQTLIESIRSGDRRRLGELYERNVGLLRIVARRYLGVDRAVGIDDLMQAGFLGLLAAVDAWEADRGAWTTYATYHIRRAMADAVGLRGSRVRAHLGAVSLDEVLPGGDAEGASRLDLLADESLSDPDEGLLQGEIAHTVRAAVDAIPDARQAEAVRLYRLEGIKQREAAERIGCSINLLRQLEKRGRQALRHDANLRRLVREYHLDERTRVYAHKGLTAFRSDFTSTVEAAVLWRDEQRRKWNERMDWNGAGYLYRKAAEGTDRTGI